MRKRPLADGTIFWWYLLLAPASRFIIEFWRINPPLAFGLSALRGLERHEGRYLWSLSRSRHMYKRYHVTTFGCQMNEHDSERMKGMLESLGYEEAAERDRADLILFNTCSIR